MEHPGGFISAMQIANYQAKEEEYASDYRLPGNFEFIS